MRSCRRWPSWSTTASSRSSISCWSTKELDGSLTTIEIGDLDADAQAAFGRLDGEVDGLLSEDDLATASEVLSPGSSAMLIVWENTWARRLVDAIGGSGGRLVAHDRIDAETAAKANVLGLG